MEGIYSKISINIFNDDPSHAYLGIVPDEKDNQSLVNNFIDVVLLSTSSIMQRVCKVEVTQVVKNRY